MFSFLKELTFTLQDITVVGVLLSKIHFTEGQCPVVQFVCNYPSRFFVKRKDENGMHGGIAHSSCWICGRFDLKTTQKCGVGWGGLRQREPYFGAKVH